MFASSARITATAIAEGITVGCYGLTFQPQRPFGPIPILLWLSIPVVVIGGLTLGVELSHRFTRMQQVTTALAQLGSIALVQTCGMVVGWGLDPAFFDSGVVRTYYGVPLLLAIPLIVLYHLVGWVRNRSGEEQSASLSLSP